MPEPDGQSLPPLLTAQQVADLLGVSRRTLYRFIAEGLPVPQPVRRSRKFVRWLRADIERFAQSLS